MDTSTNTDNVQHDTGTGTGTNTVQHDTGTGTNTVQHDTGTGTNTVQHDTGTGTNTVQNSDDYQEMGTENLLRLVLLQQQRLLEQFTPDLIRNTLLQFRNDIIEQLQGAQNQTDTHLRDIRHNQLQLHGDILAHNGALNQHHSTLQGIGLTLCDLVSQEQHLLRTHVYEESDRHYQWLCLFEQAWDWLTMLLRDMYRHVQAGETSFARRFHQQVSMFIGLGLQSYFALVGILIAHSKLYSRGAIFPISTVLIVFSCFAAKYLLGVYQRSVIDPAAMRFFRVMRFMCFTAAAAAPFLLFAEAFIEGRARMWCQIIVAICCIIGFVLSCIITGDMF